MSGPCCINPGAKQNHMLRGNIEEVAGLSTYKTGHGKSAIVIFAELFGYTFVNTQKVADTFADATGTTVLVPDLFNGDPMDPDDPHLMEHLPGWLNKHPLNEACSLSAKFISTVKEQYNRIQVIGFCYGAKPVIYLISQGVLSSDITAAIAAHPSFLVEEEAVQIKRPILFICAETDDVFDPDLRQHFEKTLAPTGLAQFKDYPGTVHGFVIRPDGSEHVSQQRDKAIDDTIEFLKKNL